MQQIDRNEAQRLITLCSAAIKGIAFYPPSHPVIHQPLMELEQLIATMIPAEQKVRWGVLDGVMYFDDHLFASPSTATAELAARFSERGVSGITLLSGIGIAELEAFAGAFAVRGADSEKIREILQEAGVSRILIDDDQDEDLPVKVYGDSLLAVQNICREIESGRIPGSGPVLDAVDRMLVVTMREPSTMVGLAMLKDYDNYTFNHCVNVGILSMALGTSVGLDSEQIKVLGVAGHLHDVGKVMVSREVLNKPGKLTTAEFEEMKRHAELGESIVNQMIGIDPEVVRIVLGHHRRSDRSGYPERAVKLPDDPMIDIIAIADTYDALTTLRVYQAAVSPRAALQSMERLSGPVLNTELFEKFKLLLGPYPVGTLVRLDNNEIGVVSQPNPFVPAAPVVRVLFDPEGVQLALPKECATGDGMQRIVATVDPHVKGLDVGKILSAI
jgi:putative nucleotidyltransferase with HDIG domain